jgi:hypothetical protein
VEDRRTQDPAYWIALGYGPCTNASVPRFDAPSPQLSVHSSDDEGDITFEEPEDAMTQLDSGVNWNLPTATARKMQQTPDSKAPRTDSRQRQHTTGSILKQLPVTVTQQQPDCQQSGTKRLQPAARETRTGSSVVGGGARSLPTRTRQIAAPYPCMTAQSPYRGAAQAVQEENESGIFGEARPTTTSARVTQGAS